MGSCMLTVMGIKARDMQIDLKGAIATVEKIMASDPRRISEIRVKLEMPEKLSGKDQKILENTGRTCPVLMSIHPDIKKDIRFIWG